ncbi:MAG TPA: alpha/beta hydrolase [Bryobacteraceae bacterium]|nr:alpha/beta hydrolase [Bryobacteraceae bacterium]
MPMLRFLLVVASAALALSAQTVPAPVRLPAGVTVQENVPYDTYPQTVMDIYQPPGPGPHPAMIIIHGGGWTAGQKSGMVGPWVLRYLQKGFVVANVEYRLAAVAPAPAAVEDALKAANFFIDSARKYGADPKRVSVTGGSAGGHLALMVGMAPKSAKLGKPVKVRAVINFYGITDVDDQLHGVNERQYATTWVPAGPDRTALARRVSPMTYVRKDVPPILTVHGDADATVPYEHGVKLTKALKDAGAEAELIPVPKGPHGFPKETLDGLYPQIFEFLKKHGAM